MPPSSRRRFVFWFLISASLATACARAADERWVKVTTDYFTVLTTAGEPAARKWAVELAEFRRSLQSIVPVPVARLQPVTVVLFKNDAAIRPFLPLENGAPARIGGLFVRTNDVNTIMLSLARDERETRHIIFHEAVHWHLNALQLPLPLWLSEGLAELYATFEVPDPAHYQFGAALPGHVAQFSSGNFLPLGQLIATTPGSVLYNESRRGNIFYAESWALVHLLLLGADAPGVPALNRYVEVLRDPRAGETAFVGAFGNIAVVEQRLRVYVRERNYRPVVRPHTDTNIVCAVATPAPGETDLALGSLLAGSRDASTAEPYLRRATQLMPADPRGWELLGVTLATRAAASQDGKLTDAAATCFRRTIELSPEHVAGYEGLAGMVYSMATFHPQDASLLARGLTLAPENPSIEAGVAACEIRAGNVEAGRQRLDRLCALDRTHNAPATRYAIQILAREQFKADLAEVQKLTGASRFHEAIIVLDRALARDLSAADRNVLLGVRQGLAEIVRAGHVPVSATR